MATTRAHISLMSFLPLGTVRFPRRPIPYPSLPVRARRARRHDRRTPWKNNSRNFVVAPSIARGDGDMALTDAENNIAIRSIHDDIAVSELLVVMGYTDKKSTRFELSQ